MVTSKSSVVLTLALLALAAPARAADPDQVASAKRFLTDQSRARVILFFMHPTAEYRSMTFAGVTGVVDNQQRELKDWFCLEYRFNWKSELFDDVHYSYLKVFFDDRGKLHSLQAGRTSTFVPEFTGLNIAIAVGKDKLLESLQDDPKTQAVVRRLIENGDAKGLLTFILKVDQK